jgi:hypothetical protein
LRHFAQLPASARLDYHVVAVAQIGYFAGVEMIELSNF